MRFNEMIQSGNPEDFNGSSGKAQCAPTRRSTGISGSSSIARRRQVRHPLAVSQEYGIPAAKCMEAPSRRWWTPRDVAGRALPVEQGARVATISMTVNYLRRPWAISCAGPVCEGRPQPSFVEAEVLDGAATSCAGRAQLRAGRRPKPRMRDEG